MITLYRVYDHTTQTTLAQGIISHEQAQEILHFLKLESPNCELEIEAYTKYTVRGMGRDPDLH